MAHPSSAATSYTAATHRRTSYRALATGFGTGTTTVYRYLREALELTAATPPSLPAAGDRGRPREGLRHPRRDLAADRPGRHELRSGPALYAAGHQCHGVSVQVIADPAGGLIWASPAPPGARHDMGAAHEHGIVEAINTAGVQAVADTPTRAAAAAVRVRQRRRRLVTTPPLRPMSRSQREVNTAQARQRGPGERATSD